MKPTRAKSFDVAIATTNTPQSIRPNEPKGTFRKIYIYQASAAAANGILTDNANDMYIGFESDGPKVMTDLVAAGSGPFSFTVPDSLPEMMLKDVYIYGTATDGAFIVYITANPV
jgi:hypothetical protein